MTTKKLTLRQKILVAGTLFGMFFGAGNLIFPVHLGQMAGRNALPAIIGFIITAVGIPILGVAAIGVTCTNPQVTSDCDVYFRICFLDPFQGTVCLLYTSPSPRDS